MMGQRAIRCRGVWAVVAWLLLSAGSTRLEAQATDAAGLIVSDQWLALGPFTNPFGCSGRQEDLYGNHIAPACIQCEFPEEGDSIEYDVDQAVSTGYFGPTDGGGAPMWRLFDDGTIDGDQDLDIDATNLGAPAEDVMTWLVTYFEYTGDEPVDVTFCFGSDDGGQILIDDQIVHSNNACRGRDNCQDQPMATITPGVHRIAAAAWDRGGGWGFRLGMNVDGVPVIDDAATFPEWIFLGTEGGIDPPDDCSCDFAPGCNEFNVSPRATTIRTGETVQLVPKARNDDGIPVAPVTTYAVAPEGIVTVSESGLVEAVAEGEATITAMCEDGSTVDVLINVLDFIDLGNIAAGGNGVEPPPEGNIGINADFGTFVQARLNTDVPETNLINPQPVDGFDGADDSPFIDSVFIIDLGVGQPISTSGVMFDFAAGDVAGGWEAILNGREPGGPDSLSFGAVTYTRGVGLHAAQGITYDLEALREEYGADRVKFASAVAGEASGQANGHVNAYMILSNESEILESRSVLDATDRGEFIELAIPDDALYLTLAVGAAGDGIGSDHGGFGNAQITSSPIEKDACTNLRVSPASISLAPGGTTQLAAMVSDVFGLDQDRTSHADTSYSVDPEGIVTLNETGLVTAVALGEAEITVTACEESVVVPVTVERFIDLGSIVSGGDGSGVGEFAAIDIDTGAFLTRDVVDTLNANSIDTDGINPSPVFDSDFVDSVFFLTDQFQAINQEEVIFEFLPDEPFANSWNHILANKTHDIDKGNEDVVVGGQTFGTGVGIHAAAGITFDLAAMRDELGADAVGRFHTFAGVDNCGGNISLYIIYSDADGIIEDPAANDDRGVWAVRVQAGSPAEEYDAEIPDGAEYLTLAVGGRDGIGCAHGVFANARILPGEGGVTGPKFIRGNADGQGAINITDGVFVLNYLFTGGGDPPCKDAADADDSGIINITDGVYILNFLFTGGADPRPPFPACGEDPTEDSVTCDTPPAACE